MITIKCKAYSSTQNFTIAFREAIDRLDTLKAPLLPIHVVNIFLFAVADSFAVWAERQRSALRIDRAPDLEALIADLLDENRSRNANQKPSGSSALLKKDDNKAKGAGGNGQQANGSKNKKKDKGGKKCKHCKQPDPKHSEEDCFTVNAEKRKAWESKSGKTWVPYTEFKRNQKEKDTQESDNESKHGFATLTNQLTQSYGTTALVNLHQDKWLADSGADGHVTNNKDLFVEYQECDLRPVQTAGGSVKPPGLGTIQLKVLKTDRSTMELTLYDVTYMPWCPINLLGVGKLMK